MSRDGVAVVACGHTHIPRSVRLADGTLVVNPGSVGLRAFFGDSPELHPMETGSPDARHAILERSAAGWRTELVAVPYDAREMARLAAEHGRPEWEHVLRTGCVRARRRRGRARGALADRAPGPSRPPRSRVDSAANQERMDDRRGVAARRPEGEGAW